jgi:hypothetical protein
MRENKKEARGFAKPGISKQRGHKDEARHSIREGFARHLKSFVS